jgi:hypothetical protein
MACGAVHPRRANTIEHCEVDGELTATRAAACHDAERLTVFSENSDPARELTIASRPCDVWRLTQKIGWSTQRSSRNAAGWSARTYDAGALKPSVRISSARRIRVGAFTLLLLY